MMRTMIGIDEAKNKLSELLDRVEAGEFFAITRRGKQVALLTPVHHERPSASRQSRGFAISERAHAFAD